MQLRVMGDQLAAVVQVETHKTVVDQGVLVLVVEAQPHRPVEVVL